jgi:phosphohistidine phosphatase
VKTLILMRHAKSDYPDGVPDFDRPLAPRGERDADAAGIWLAAAFPIIDEVVVSPARRARDTWARCAPHLDARDVREDRRIYDDWGSCLPDVVAGIHAGAETALIVGHNPGIEEYAERLAAAGDSAARARMMRKFPTCGIAVIGMHADAAGGDSSLLHAFAVPRG